MQPSRQYHTPPNGRKIIRTYLYNIYIYIMQIVIVLMLKWNIFFFFFFFFAIALLVPLLLFWTMSSVIGEVGVYAPAPHRLRSPFVFQINTSRIARERTSETYNPVGTA